jgi:hypothetical protein
MHRILNVAAIVIATFALCTSLPAQSKKALKAEANKKTESEIKKLESELARLIMSGNADAYGQHLADDYVLINAVGSVVSKAQILSAMKAGASSDSLLPVDMSVRVYGETAVLNDRVIWKGVVNGANLERDWLSTKVFLRRNGKWVLVNSQGTALPPRQGAK